MAMEQEQLDQDARNRAVINLKEAMPIKAVKDLEGLDSLVQDICRGISHPIGSIFRVPWQYLVNWGVGVTEDNAHHIEKLSIKSYQEEWERSIKETYTAIRDATIGAGFRKDNRDLNDAVGSLATNALWGMMEADPTREFKVVDIGAGEGETTIAVLDFIRLAIEQETISPDILERCKFELVEPSPEALFNPGKEGEGGAYQRLRHHPIRKYGKLNFTLIGSETHEFLSEMTPGNFDMVISSAVFHHMTFPTYLDLIEDSVKDDGVLVVGDWYTRIWKYPVFVADVLQRLNMDSDRLREFRQLFGIKEGDLELRLKELNEEEEKELTTYRLMIDFVVDMGNRFISNNIPPESRLFFLEGHEGYEDRIEKVTDAGFVYGLKELRKNEHPGFMNMLSNRIDLEPDKRCARAFAAAKLPGRKKKRRPSKPPSARKSVPPLKA